MMLSFHFFPFALSPVVCEESADPKPHNLKGLASNIFKETLLL